MFTRDNIDNLNNLINFERIIGSYNYFYIICSKKYILKIIINFLLH